MEFLKSKGRKVALICNPVSGRRRGRRPHQIQAAREELERAGMSVSIYQTTCAGEGAELARKAIQAGAELILVCGGDGTMNDVAGALAGTPIPMGVLPCGTANVLARELGVPLDVPAAARLIPQSIPRRVALGRAGQRYFILMAGVGFDAHVVRTVSWRCKRLFGMAGYVMEALRQLMFSPPRPFLLTADSRQYRATFACIARAQYYGPVRLLREANLFSDNFYVYCFNSVNPVRYLLYTAALLTAQHTRLRDFSGFSTQNVRCEQISATPTFVQVDGEPAGELPCSIEIVPDALTLLIPPPTKIAMQ